MIDEKNKNCKPTEIPNKNNLNNVSVKSVMNKSTNEERSKNKLFNCQISKNLQVFFEEEDFSK